MARITSLSREHPLADVAGSIITMNRVKLAPAWPLGPLYRHWPHFLYAF